MENYRHSPAANPSAKLGDEAKRYVERLRTLMSQASAQHRQRESSGWCPACRGLRWLRLDLPISHPEFGKLTPCNVCGGTRTEEWLTQVCNLAGDELAYSFDSWKLITHERVAILESARFLLDARGGWLTVYGDYGAGKTYLGAAIINAGRKAKIESRYWLMARLLDHLRQAFDPQHGPGWSNLFDDLVECPLLVIDELDTFHPTTWAMERFGMLARERDRMSREKVTVWISNVAPADLPSEFDFLRSRMSSWPAVRLAGDVRPERRE